MSSLPLSIRPATPDDLTQLDAFVRDLAQEEGLPEATARPSDLEEALFGADAFAHAILAEADGQAVGFALYYAKYATVSGRRGIHIEDLYVAPAFRNNQIGRRLIEWLQQHVGPRGMVEWWVMRSSPAAIRFYQRLGARELDGIAVYRLDHPDLDQQSSLTGLSSAEVSSHLTMARTNTD